MADEFQVITNNGAQPVPSEQVYTGTQVQFIDNPLGNFAQVAYHITLYAVGDVAAYNSTDEGKIIIAESGVTGYNIRDLIIDGVVAPSDKTRGTVATKMTFTITEPSGTSFLDSMYDAVLAAGGSNWQKAVYRIDLRFKAYKENGQIIPWLDSSHGMPKDGKWTWKIMIGDIETNLDASGATYKVTARPIEESVPWEAPSVTALKATTIGEFFQALEAHMNGADQKKTNTSPWDEPTIKYHFKIYNLEDGTDPKSWSVLGKWQDPFFHPMFHKGLKAEDKDKGVFNLDRGMKIPDIVDAVFAVSEQAQARIKNSKKPVTDPNDHGDGTFRDALVFRTYAENIITGYDYVNQHLKMEVTYHIKPYQAQHNWLLSDETTKEGNGKLAIDALVGYDGLKKRYEYLYTGLNTEVIHLDLKFNFQFVASMPRGNGDNYYSDNVVWHARMPKDPKEEADKIKAKQDSEKAQADRDNRESLTRIRNAIEAGNLTAEELQDFVTQYRNIAAAIQAQAEYEAKQRAIRAQNAGVIYAEDITERQANPAIVSTGQSSGEGARQGANSGHTGQRHRAKSVYGALLDQIYAPTKELTLKIKGDPYWLGDDQTRAVSERAQPGLADFYRGDVGFLLYFRYPKGVTDAGVPIIWQDSQVFNAVYTATFIQHSFANGAFTTTIKARRLRPTQATDIAPLANVQVAAQSSYPPGGY
jgi:hypothetical protein